jgi:hypothetical protein
LASLTTALLLGAWASASSSAAAWGAWCTVVPLCAWVRVRVRVRFRVGDRDRVRVRVRVRVRYP